MKQNFELGHYNNAANLQKMISYVSSYGEAYNPANPTIATPQLQALLDGYNAVLLRVDDSYSMLTNAIIARETVFIPLSKYVTKVMNALSSLNVSVNTVESARSFVRKIRGERVSPVKTEEEIAALKSEGIDVKQISVSQMSYDSRLGNFQRFITLLESIPEYSPNEGYLKTEGLQMYYADLKNKNGDAIEAYTELSNARIARDRLVFIGNTSLMETARNVKSYVRSVFGATSPEYKQISALKFKSQKPVIQVPTGVYIPPEP
jgi:hypothetical protein